MLDGSGSRVRMLIASAGYGKTTLAEQWAAAAGRQAVWYRCRNASADVAFLAVGLAEVASELLPGCDRRLRERLIATRDPSVEVEILADMLAEDVANWPPEAWLVIDDYHLVLRSPEAERFVEILFERSPVNLLIASRERPTWLTSRLLLYGQLFELDQADLAMDSDETDSMLDEQRAATADGLVALADGWPAVIGLACVTNSDVSTPGATPEQLYEFFAEEIYRRLDTEVQIDLGVIAVAPALDREVVHALLGTTRGDRVIAESRGIGILDNRDGRLGLHPLARVFFETRAHRDALARRPSAVRICLQIYKERGDWDSAFELIERSGRER